MLHYTSASVLGQWKKGNHDKDKYRNSSSSGSGIGSHIKYELFDSGWFHHRQIVQYLSATTKIDFFLLCFAASLSTYSICISYFLILLAQNLLRKFHNLLIV